MSNRIRAVAVIIDNERLLLMHRWNNGKEYFVFPGGGVEAGETIEAALMREASEETSLNIMIDKIIYHDIYDDGTERFYYLCNLLSGEPKLGNGPEFKLDDPSNRYRPEWIKIDSLQELLIYPLETRDRLIEDLAINFTRTPRAYSYKVSEMRQTIDK